MDRTHARTHTHTHNVRFFLHIVYPDRTELDRTHREMGAGFGKSQNDFVDFWWVSFPAAVLFTGFVGTTITRVS
jgi:hypothetical protein